MKNERCKSYIAKPKTWFDAGTEADLVDDYRPEFNSGVFYGWKDGKKEYQVCEFKEFKIRYTAE